MYAARKGPGLVRHNVQQASGDGGEAVRLALHREKTRQEKAEGIVERVIHHPHARSSHGEGSKALGLLFETEQCGLVEGRAAGEIAARDRFVRGRSDSSFW